MDLNLVCDSENWCTYKTWFVLSSGVFYSCKVYVRWGYKYLQFSLTKSAVWESFTGYRHIRLLSATGENLDPATLFVHVTITSISDAGVGKGY